jgi:hypothetical protein
MNGKRPIWLVINPSSGSNDDATLAALEECCGANGFRIARRTAFPDEPLPTADVLDAAGIDRVAVFTGDGTINSLIGELAGWEGAVLVLPGGTMNLLSRRLHGDRSAEEIVAAVAQGGVRLHRPGVIRCAYGTALAGMMAGPGTSWGRVREAMREAAIADLAESAIAAIGETLGGERIACTAPALGNAEGYPLIHMVPHDDGIVLQAFHAETPGEYLEQAWALIRRDFREGPHEDLGRLCAFTLASTEGHPFGLLIDGEEVEAGASVEFTLAACEVDLVATTPDGH